MPEKIPFVYRKLLVKINGKHLTPYEFKRNLITVRLNLSDWLPILKELQDMGLAEMNGRKIRIKKLIL